MSDYKLPSGIRTRSVRRYLKEWRQITRAVERALDVRVYAFDPDLAVTNEGGTGYAEIPLWLENRIAAMEKVTP